jgi:ribosome-associated translation inhibitor RaiA
MCPAGRQPLKGGGGTIIISTAGRRSAVRANEVPASAITSFAEYLMQTPVQIAFHGLDKSEALEGRIRGKVEKLEQYFDRITSCHVTVERHHRSKTVENQKDQPFHVSIFLGVPGDELVVKRDPKDRDSLKDHQDVQVAVRDAFESMERQLKEYVKRRFRDARHGTNGEDVAAS